MADKIKQTYERDLLNLTKNFSFEQFKLVFDKYSSHVQHSTLRLNNTYPLIPFLIKSNVDEKSLNATLQYIFKKRKFTVAEFDQSDSFGWSAVHYAVLKNYATLLNELINYGFRIDTASSEQIKPDDYYYLPKTTPLQICAWHGNVILAKHLLNKGADINTVNGSGWNLLLIACHENRKEFVEFILEKGLSPNSTGSKQPLHVCARWNFKELVAVLVNAKANIDAVNLYGQTPLLVAITNSNKETANELIRCGAYVQTLDKFNNNLLHIIAETNLVDVAENLIKSGVDLNARNNKQLTPLHVSAKKGNAEMAKIFLEHSANIDQVDNNGDTALMMACENGFNEMVKFLLSRNANRDIYNSQGYAALHICLLENRLDTFKLLIESGDDCNKPELSNNKGTPLHLAIETANQQIFDYLVNEKKALTDINYQDSDGVTPLYLAAVKGN